MRLRRREPERENSARLLSSSVEQDEEKGGSQGSGKAKLGIDIIIIIIILLEENYMAANQFNVRVSVFVRVNVRLCGGSFESPPGVEAACEAVRLVSLPHQSQLPGVFGVLRAHVLDVNLAGFETQFDLHLAGLSTDPHVHLFAVVQQHDVIISQVVLTEV